LAERTAPRRRCRNRLKNTQSSALRGTDDSARESKHASFSRYEFFQILDPPCLIPRRCSSRNVNRKSDERNRHEVRRVSRYRAIVGQRHAIRRIRLILVHGRLPQPGNEITRISMRQIVSHVSFWLSHESFSSPGDSPWVRHTFSIQLARSLAHSFSHAHSRNRIVSHRRRSHLIRRAISHGVQGVLDNVGLTKARMRDPHWSIPRGTSASFIPWYTSSVRPSFSLSRVYRVWSCPRVHTYATRRDKSAMNTTAPWICARLALSLYAYCETTRTRACHRMLTNLPRAIVKKYHTRLARAARVLPSIRGRWLRAQSRFETGVLIAGMAPGDSVPRDSFFVAELFILKKFFLEFLYVLLFYVFLLSAQ